MSSPAGPPSLQWNHLFHSLAEARLAAKSDVQALLFDVFVDGAVLLHQLAETGEPLDRREGQHAAFQGSSPNLHTSRR